MRGHAPEIEDIRFDGAGVSQPAPGVIEAIKASDALIIGPSNPVLSVWPILAVPAIGQAVAQKNQVVAVSPLIGGSAVKGPAHRILAALGYGTGTRAVIESYGGLLTDLVIDNADAGDAIARGKSRIHVTDTRMSDLSSSTRLAQVVIDAIRTGPVL